jgi:predicted esterase
LKPESTSQFPSSLATNGTVGWSTLTAKSSRNEDSGAKAALSVNFTNVDWSFLQSIYGWSALQCQAWARGEIFVTAEKEKTVILYTDSLLEYALDGVRHFGGDFYTFRKAPVVLHLSPGRHVIDLRLVRDVRSMGGVGSPSIDVNLELRAVSSELEMGNDRIIISDVVNGQLVSPYGSFTVRNNGRNWIHIDGISDTESTTRLVGNEKGGRLIAPGQTRPIVFHTTVRNLNASGPIPDTPVTIHYSVQSSEQTTGKLVFNLKLKRQSMYDSHKVTHLHPGGIVSYAMLRPPSMNASCASHTKDTAPILLQFHGAGLEADNRMVAHAMDPLPDLCAWILFPTGVTPWSADDWHNWGFADVEAAVNSIPEWIKTTGWQGVGVDTEKWFISGHSNGGQGSWYALTHRPDKVFAAAPASGYLSIHSYVPYQFWRTMDPRRRAVLEASANSYRHELLASNAKGIPIFQQHGSMDDNVPAYHSRLMSQLLSETGWPSKYSELSGKGHWFDGIMTTVGLQEFYREQLNNQKPLSNSSVFELVVANPGDMGSKEGVEVLYLEDPGQLGKVHASYDHDLTEWSFKTGNVLAFQLNNKKGIPNQVKIDGQSIPLERSDAANKDGRLKFFKFGQGIWKQQVSKATIPSRWNCFCRPAQRCLRLRAPSVSYLHMVSSHSEDFKSWRESEQSQYTASVNFTDKVTGPTTRLTDPQPAWGNGCYTTHKRQLQNCLLRKRFI